MLTRGLSRGCDVAVFPEMDDFARESSEGIEETGVFERVFSEFLQQSFSREGAEEIEVLAGDDLECGFGKCGGVVRGDHFHGGFAIGFDEGEAFLLLDVTEVAGFAPVGDVHFRDGVWERRIGGDLEFIDDFAGGQGVIEARVDEVAEWFGEFGDFSVDGLRDF